MQLSSMLHPGAQARMNVAILSGANLGSNSLSIFVLKSGSMLYEEKSMNRWFTFKFSKPRYHAVPTSLGISYACEFGSHRAR